MKLEHLVYSIAIAIIFGMIYRRITGRECSWIIVLSAYAPDIDIIADAVLRKIGVTVLVYGAPIDHGSQHKCFACLCCGSFILTSSSRHSLYGFLHLC